MDAQSTLPADPVAQRIVRHFQSQGFPGISEALILRISLRKGDRSAVDSIFDTALEHDRMPPVQECFDIRAYGHFAASRSFAEARAALAQDFGHSLRIELPKIFFAPAPVLVDDALATGTRYDAMIKLSDNVGGTAYAVLLNDPDASFLDYLGTHHGTDWQAIMGNFESATAALGEEIDLG